MAAGECREYDDATVLEQRMSKSSGKAAGYRRS